MLQKPQILENLGLAENSPKKVQNRLTDAKIPPKRPKIPLKQAQKPYKCLSRALRPQKLIFRIFSYFFGFSILSRYFIYNI